MEMGENPPKGKISDMMTARLLILASKHMGP